jgi:hypothetical protein
MVAICGIINLYKGSGHTNFDFANLILSWVFLVGMFVTLALLTLFLWINFKKIKEYKDSLGSLLD